MSYQVLARKWRPRTFRSMVGQEHILRMLTNALTQQRIHHAYLFTGTRGVGKTTLARILAKCLNCETGMSATPCDTCANCLAIDAGNCLDLYEVDAASRTKVEDTRELLDNVLYPPTQGRYKIYLIDEVHMLSNHSFNALLKTLEEPPAHVKFLLATTDPKKLPITILSRCLQFHLKRITPEQIAQHLQFICAEEHITVETPAIDKLAKAADGSLRDALSLLDQAIAYGEGSVTTQYTYAMLGSLPQDDLFPLLDALAAQNGQQLFDVTATLAERAPDFYQVLEELTQLFHHIALAQVVPTALPDNHPALAFTKRFSAEDIQLYYQIALLGKRDLSLAPTPQQGFEMALLRMLAFQLAASDTIPATPKTSDIKPISQPIQLIAPATVVTPLPEWRDILPKLDLSGMAYALASNCSLIQLTDTTVELAIATSHQPMLNPKLKERLAEALSRYLQRPIQLDIKTTTETLSTPIKQQKQEQDAELTSAKQNIMQHPHIQQLIDLYDATVEVSLL